MARLVTKFKYLKPDKRKSVGNYARYIATREGVEKIDVSKKFAPVTKSQIELIQKLIADFPESKESLEYQDYIKSQTIGSASDFIMHTMEDYCYEISGRKTYAKYIATRPRAERFGSHGLFTDDGVEVKLTEVVNELDNHNGNIWTAIISLRREDADRLGYNNGENWRELIRSRIDLIAQNLKIPFNSLHWYGAFHNETHHPHIHLILYSDNLSKGYLTEQGLNNIRSALATEIFSRDLISVYKKQTEHRDSLRDKISDIIDNAVDSLNSGTYDNPELESMLYELAAALSKTKGKKVYGYLSADIKNIIDRIINVLSEDDRIKTLYDLWYEQRENVIKIYTDELPERVPLVDNKEFKKIKNAIIKEVMNLFLDKEESADNISSDNPTTNVSEPHTYTTNGDRQNHGEKQHSNITKQKQLAAMACLRLLRYLANLIRRNIEEDEQKMVTESKTKRKTEDKKQGLGLH